jgi:LmbE family N-acetylglucosaminyl deacetylase
MLKTLFAAEPQSELTLLCLGAHSDDIEIGCGGTVLRLLEEFPAARVVWIVLGATGRRSEEAKQSAALFLKSAAHKEVILKSFRDGFFPYIGGEIKNFFEELKGEISPDLILTHFRHDLHQDHRLVSELTWNTFRDHTVLEYEIVKYDGDLGSPNFFVHLDEATCRRKVDNILDCFTTQRDRHWFTEDTFLSLMRIRGVESGSQGRYAEGFYSRKLVY